MKKYLELNEHENTKCMGHIKRSTEKSTYTFKYVYQETIRVKKKYAQHLTEEVIKHNIKANPMKKKL